MKKLIVIIYFLSLLSCDHFSVSNDNPDVTLSIKNNPELLLTNLQKNSINTAVGSAWGEGNIMAQYGAKIVFTEFDLFGWGNQSGTWNSLYLAIRDAKELQAIAEETGNLSYKAVSLIMQAWMFQILTDLWGDIPYSEASGAGSESTLYTPKYDTQEEVYNGLIDNLKEANDILSGNNLQSVKGDILLNGDLVKWRKFANSLRLRVAMRIQRVKPEQAKSEFVDIAASPTQYPLIESNADNVALRYLSANPNAHPNTEESVYRVGSYNEYRISETLEGILREYDDPRLYKWADPTANSVESGKPEISGMKNGIVDGPAYEYKGGDAFLSKFNIDYFYFQANANQGRLMQYAEVQFLLAEAANRGWIEEDAEVYYNEGVAASFSYWDTEMPEDYLERQAVAYDGDLEKIINQKYLSLFYTDFQGFIEFKRTGFPTTIIPGPDAAYSTYPSRFQYPSEEISLNASNREEVINRQGPDEITTKVWWEK